MIRRIAKSLGSFLRRKDGSASLEFVIIFPAFMIMFISAIELYVVNLRSMMLERAVDINVRALRLGFLRGATFEDLKVTLCDAAVIIPNCQESISIQMVRVDTGTWQPLDPDAECIDRTEDYEPTLDPLPGIPNDLMLIRVCAVFDPMFPTAGLSQQMALDTSGGYAVVASTAFVVEPL